MEIILPWILVGITSALLVIAAVIIFRFYKSAGAEQASELTSVQEIFSNAGGKDNAEPAAEDGDLFLHLGEREADGILASGIEPEVAFGALREKAGASERCAHSLKL